MNVHKIVTTIEELKEVVKSIEESGFDKPHLIEFKPFRKSRSLKQNAVMWMWFRCIKDETGNDVDTLYEYFCEKYLPWSEKELFGNGVRMVGGTSQLNTKEFDDFLENIRMEMLHMNIILPNPNDQGWDEFYAKYCGG
jgi:hypothetical protein